MPPPYRAHVFICTNRRPDGSPKGCCASKGSEELKLEFKKELDAAHIGDVRANTSGCLDACERGPSVVVYPQGVWYGGVTKADVKEIVEKHLRDGEVVQRLVMAPFERKKG